MHNFVIGGTDDIEKQTSRGQFILDFFLVIAGFSSSEALVIFKLKVFNSFMLDFVMGGTDGIEIQSMRDQILLNFLVIAGFSSSEALVILQIKVYNSLMQILLSGILICF